MSMRNWFKEPDPNRRKDEAAFGVKIKDKPSLAAIREDPRRIAAGVVSLALIAMLIIYGLRPAATSDDLPLPPSEQAGAASDMKLEQDCVLRQHLIFAPCGHELTRRESLPQDLIGKTRAELESAYDLWRVTSYAPREVAMEQQLSMYCPEHLVLMPDDSGMLCVWRNVYGDALSLQRELHIPLTDFPDDLQSLLRAGLGFSTESDLTQWLESTES